MMPCTLVLALAACGREAPIVGRPATEAEKDAMPHFLVTLDGGQITILSPLRPELPGCMVVLDQRYRLIIPPLESSIATLPLSAFIDAQGQPLRDTPTRVDVTCDGESGPVRYTGRRSSGVPTVVPWIFPDA
jgi:hypothetical protein